MASYEEELKRIKDKYETKRKLGANKSNSLVQQQSSPVVQQETPQEVAVQNADNNNWWDNTLAGIDRVGRNLAKGVYGAFEGIVDTGATIGANIGKAFGADTTGIENFIKTDYATLLAEQRVETGNAKADAFVNKILLGHGLPDIIEGVSDMTGNSNVIADNNRKIREYSNSGQALNSFGENLSQGVGSALGFARLAGIMPQGNVSQFAGMFTSAGGKSVEESLNEGHNIGEATAYGAMSGAVEARTEAFVGRLLGKIGLGTGKIAGIVGKTTSKATEKVGSNMAKKGVSQVVKNLLKNFNEEGTEEVFSDLANPIIRMIAYSDYEQDKNWLENYNRLFNNNGGLNGLLQSYIYGGLSGLLFEGVQATNIVKKYGFDGYYLSDVAQELGEAEEKLTKAVKQNNQAKIDSLVAEIKEIQEKNKNKFERYASMIQELEQKTGFTLNDYLDDNGDLDLSKFNTNSKGEIVFTKDQKKVINKSSYLSSLKSEINAGTVQERMIRQTIDEFNEGRQDKIKLNFLSQENFIKAQQQNGVKINLDTVEGLKRADSSAYIAKNGNVYINKDSLAYRQGKLFSKIGHEIMHGLEKTGTYYQMFNNEWNKMPKAEQTKVLNEYREEYKGIADSNLALKKEWFADYIGKNALGNYKQFTKQLKKTNAITRAIMNWRKENTVKSALEERKVKKSKAKADYAVETENAGAKATSRTELAYSLKENDNGEQYSNEFRRLQEESRKRLNNFSREGTYAKDNERLRRRLSNILKRELANRGVNSSTNQLLHLEAKEKGTFFNIYKDVDAKTFHDIFEVNKGFLFNGELVDLHNIKDYEETTNYLSKDGLSGFAITKDGDLISVFNNNDKKGFLYAIKNIVLENVKTLDCYVSNQQDLQKMYSKVFGFKTASIMEYNMEYDHDDIAKNHNMPKVAFMVNTNIEVDTKEFNKDQYNEAKQYQLDNIDKKVKYQLSDETDSEGNKLTKEVAERFKDSKVRDENGNLLVMYHGTRNAGFTIFNPNSDKEDLGNYRFKGNVVNFFTPNIEGAFTYSGTANEVDPYNIKNTFIERKEELIKQFNKNIKEFDERFGKEKNNYIDLDTGEILTEEEYREAKNNYIYELFEDYSIYGDYSKYLKDFIKEVGEERIKKNIKGGFSVKVLRRAFDYAIEKGYSKAQEGNYKVYLNIENPYIINGKGRYWNDLFPITQKEKNEIKNKIKIDEIISGFLKLKKEIGYGNGYNFESETNLAKALEFLKSLNVGFDYSYGEAFPYFEEISLDDEDDFFNDNTKVYSLFYNGNKIFDNENGNILRPTYILKQVTEIEHKKQSTNDIVKQAIKNGSYDGVIFKNIYDFGNEADSPRKPIDVYVTIKSENQIKSVYNPNPTDNPDIRYSLGDFDSEKYQKLLKDTLTKTEQYLIKKDDNTLAKIKEIESKIDKVADFGEFLNIKREINNLGKQNQEDNTGITKAKTELTERLNKLLADYPEIESNEQTRNKLLKENLTIDNIRKNIESIKSQNDIIAEELKERRNAKTLKERINLDLDDILDIAEKARERIAKESAKETNDKIKTATTSLQSALNKVYRAEKTKTYKDFEEAFNNQFEDYKAQLKDLGLSDDEIAEKIKPFTFNLKDIKENYEQYEKFKTVISYKSAKSMLNEIIDVKTLQTDDADKKMSSVIDRINSLYETTIDNTFKNLDTSFETALKENKVKDIEKIHNKAQTLFEVLNNWLMPIYEEFSNSTEYNQDKYQELKDKTVEFGFAVNDYDVNSENVQEALKVQQVAEKVDKVVKANNDIVNKTVKPKVDTTNEAQVEKITKNLKPKIVEKVVEKTKIIKDVRKKSVDSVDTVKYWSQANNEKYFELKAVDEMFNLIEEEVKNCGIEFKFLFDKQGGQELVSDEIHKMLNNYRKQYGKTIRERVARIYEVMLKGAQMRLPNINGDIVWQQVTIENSNSYKIENTVKDIIRKTINTVLTQGGEKTTIAKVVSDLTTKSKDAIEKVIKENNKRYEKLQKQLDEMQTVMNGTATIKAKNVVDSKEVDSLKKQITELRETVERLISQPAELKTDKEMDKYSKTVKDLKTKLYLVQNDYDKLKRKAKAEATRVARLKSDLTGKVKIDAKFRTHLTSGLKDVFGNTFEIDNDVYKDVANELSKGHINKATNKFFDYMQSLRIQGEDGEISVSNLDDEEFKAELEQLFIQSYSGLKQSNIEKVKDKLKAKTQEVKDKLLLQKETFKVADQILKKSEAIDKMIKAKGIVRPQIATQVIKLAKMFSNISRTKAFNTDVRNAIFEFYNFLNSTVEGENITVAENLGVSIPDDLTLAIAQLQTTVNALTDKNKVSIDEMKQYKNIISQIKKFIERANPTRIIGFETFNETTGKFEKVEKMAYEWAEQSILEQKRYKELLGKQRWGINRVIDPRLVFQRLAGYNKNSIYNMLYEKLQSNQTKYETNIMAMKGIVDKFIKKSKENKQFYKSLNKKITVDGITATKGEILSLYKLIRRKQGREHIVNKLGGFMIGSVSYKNITDEMLDTLKESIEDKFDLNNKNSVGSQYIDMTIEFFEYAKELKKTTDELMKGYSNVEDGEYFPIRIASLSKQQILDVKNYYDPFSLEGARSYAFNENVKGTAGVLDIGDITKIMQTHMKQIAMYNAYSETFDTFQSLFNLKLSENKELGIESGDNLGLVTKTRFKTKDNQVYQLDRYLNSLFGDIQGVRSVETNSTSDIVNKIVGAFRSRFATFQLGANLKVMASQLASIPASMKYIKLRYLIPALVPFKTNVETPAIALYRRDSKSFVNATTLNDEIGKIGSLFTKGIQFTDKLAIDVLWRASLLQTKNKDGSFNKTKAERLFTKALRETQPNYTALDRSELLRSKNEIVKAFVMFTTQPAKNLTNFIEAVSMIHTKKKLKQQVTKADYAYVRNALTGLTVQALTYSAVGWLFNKLLNGWEEDDDDKQNELFAFIQRFINDNIIGMIPAMNNIQIDFENGFKVNPYELGSLETLNDIITNASSMIQGDFKWKTLVDTAGMVMGVPTNNMYKYTKGIMKLARLEELEAELEAGYKNLKLNNKTLVNEALNVGKTTRAKTYYKKYLNNITEFSDEATSLLFDLYKDGYTVNTKQVPNTIKVDDEEYKVDIEEVKGIYKDVSPKINSIISNMRFKKLSKDNQTALLNKIFTSYYNKAMLTQYSMNGLEKSLSKTDIIYTSKISVKNLIYLTEISEIEATEKYTRKEMVTKYIKRLNITANEKYLLYYMSGYKITDQNKRKLKTYLRTIGLSSKEITQLLEGN